MTAALVPQTTATDSSVGDPNGVLLAKTNSSTIHVKVSAITPGADAPTSFYNRLLVVSRLTEPYILQLERFYHRRLIRAGTACGGRGEPLLPLGGARSAGLRLQEGALQLADVSQVLDPLRW